MMLAAALANSDAPTTKAAEGVLEVSPTSGAADNVSQSAPYQRSPHLFLPKI